MILRYDRMGYCFSEEGALTKKVGRKPTGANSLPKHEYEHIKYVEDQRIPNPWCY